MRIAIAGGGAAGFAAAIAAKTSLSEVTIYERCSRPGRKLLSTGSGRCNMTNLNAAAENYYGTDPSFVLPAIRKFWVKETIDMFRRIGVICRHDSEGRVYPYPEQASAVLDALRLFAAGQGINIVTGFDICDISKSKKGFILRSYNGASAYADRVIAAAGGRAAPDLGSNGSGHALLKGLGHTITPLRPSLVQIKTKTDIVKKLKGIKVKAGASAGGITRFGEILFTDYGLSGIPILSLSAVIDGQSRIELDLMPDFETDNLKAMLKERTLSRPEVRLEDFFTGLINKRVGQALLKDAGIAPLSRRADSLTLEELSLICGRIKSWSFEICGTRSWNDAQVTRGGASTAEFNPETMESLLVSGLYAAGEILDIDGDCGGYNLQWAWSSGFIAGRCAAKRDITSGNAD